MESHKNIRERIFAAIVKYSEHGSVEISSETPLFGDGCVLDSMKLLEVCLFLEDMADEIGFEFDWTSEAAMSRSRGMFRTAGALADEFLSQLGNGE